MTKPDLLSFGLIWPDLARRRRRRGKASVAAQHTDPRPPTPDPRPTDANERTKPARPPAASKQSSRNISLTTPTRARTITTCIYHHDLRSLSAALPGRVALNSRVWCVVARVTRRSTARKQNKPYHPPPR